MIIGGRIGAIIGGPIAILLFTFLPILFLSHISETQNKTPILAFCIFLLVIATLLGMAWLQYFKSFLYQAKASTRYPDQPWLWRSDWATKKVLSSPGTSGRVGLFFALVGNFFVIFIISLILDDSKLSEKARKLVEFRYGVSAILAIIGLYLLWRAGSHWVTTRRYARATLTLKSIPIKRSEPFSTQINLDAAMLFSRPVKICLLCEQVESYSESGNRHTEIWSHSQQVIQQGARLDVIDLVIPRDLPSTSYGENLSNIQWWLSVHGDICGEEVGLAFELPMFE
jgi:hypothetical protein